MMQIRKRWKIAAPIDHVFECFTDIDLFKNEIARLSKQDRPNLYYDKKAPFGIGNKIILDSDGTKIVFQVREYIKPSKLCFDVHLAGKYKEKIGSLFYQITLESKGQKTIYNLNCTSEKSPNSLLSAILKIYLWGSLISANKRFRKFVLSKNT